MELRKVSPELLHQAGGSVPNGPGGRDQRGVTPEIEPGQRTRARGPQAESVVSSQGSASCGVKSRSPAIGDSPTSIKRRAVRAREARTVRTSPVCSRRVKARQTAAA